MSNLLVRNLDDAVVEQVKALALKAGMSTEAYHREILTQWVRAQAQPKARSLTQVLLNMPKLDGSEDVFIRSASNAREVDFSDVSER